MTTARRVHQAIVDSALAATGADQGWLLVAGADALVVLAAAGGTDPGGLVGTGVTVDGTRGFVVTSGQPAAIRPAPSDSSNEGAGGGSGIPGAILATPCGHEDVVGVLELVRGPDGDGFTFDDVEIVSLLADVAGAAIADDATTVEVSPPERLSVELTELASRDSQRYADIARVVEAFLGQG